MGTTTEGLTSYLFDLSHRYRLYLLSLFSIGIVGGLLHVLLNYQIKKLIDALADHAPIIPQLLLFIAYKLALHGSHFVSRLINMHYKPKLLSCIVEGMYTKTMRHSLHWFDTHLSGDISSKINDIQDSIMDLLTALLFALLHSTIILVGIGFLFFVHWMTATTLIVFAVIYTPLLALLLRKQQEISKQATQARQSAIGIMNDSISNVFSIKIIGSVQTEVQKKLLPALTQWRFWDTKNRRYDAYYVDATDTLLITLISAVQIFILAYLYTTGAISVGGFTFVVMVTLSMHTELDHLLEKILTEISPKIASLRISYQSLDTGRDHIDTIDAPSLPHSKGDIRYEKVTFGYGKVPVFKDLSVHIPQGQRVGLVGLSGAGKSTFIKCLLRYAPLESGTIFIDGHDISKVNPASLRANLSVIPQDITLFHRSILENLQLAKENATQKESEEACKKALIHEDIMRMNHGYNSIVGERGVTLSGGQRQRIAIARAILKNAPILIMDEATSALDSVTESLIQEHLFSLMHNKTMLIIAHRLSTVQHVDRILVFEDGSIKEDGTHRQLLAKKGLYATLWNAQVDGFLPEHLS